MKKRLLNLIYIFFIILFTTPCAVGQKSKSEIRKQRRADRISRWHARYHFVLENPVTDDSLLYEDDNIKVNFSIGTGVAFIMENKFDTSISIVWNDASIIMPSGDSRKIMHNGVKYIDRGQSMPNTNIPPKSNITDEIIPINNVDFNSQYGWHTNILFSAAPKAREYLVGKKFSAFIPIQLSTGRKDYNFTFRIEFY